MPTRSTFFSTQPVTDLYQAPGAGWYPSPAANLIGSSGGAVHETDTATITQTGASTSNPLLWRCDDIGPNSTVQGVRLTVKGLAISSPVTVNCEVVLLIVKDNGAGYASYVTFIQDFTANRTAADWQPDTNYGFQIWDNGSSVGTSPWTTQGFADGDAFQADGSTYYVLLRFETKNGNEHTFTLEGMQLEITFTVPFSTTIKGTLTSMGVGI